MDDQYEIETVAATTRYSVCRAVVDGGKTALYTVALTPRFTLADFDEARSFLPADGSAVELDWITPDADGDSGYWYFDFVATLAVADAA